MKINTSEWKEFNFDDIFLYNRGKRLKTSDQISGDIAYISSTKTNNGIDNYILPPSNMTIYSNAITLNNSGSIGYCFYHTYNFVASDHCTIIKVKDKKIQLNNYIFLFLKPVIETMKSKYGFAREMSDARLKKEKILLPAIKEKNKYIPDWKYMKDYIQEKSLNIIYNNSLQKTKKIINLQNINWQEFTINSLFKLKKGERLIEADRVIGEIPLITASSYNNGITGFIDFKYFENRKKYFENKITIDMFGNVFYHNYKYFSDDNIHTLILKENITLSSYTQMFLVSVLKKLSPKYGFGRQVRLNRLEKEIIKLPIIKKDTPDWNFMDKYIKSIPYSSNI